jgi:hypothetical protein
MVRVSYQMTLCPLWAEKPHLTTAPHAAGLVAEFPPEWSGRLAGVRFGSYVALDRERMVWNPDHALVEAVDSDAQKWVAETFRGGLDPVPWRAELVANAARAAAWLMLCLAQRSWELWEGLEDRAPGLQEEIWNVLFNDSLAPTLATETSSLLAAVWNEETAQRALDIPLRGRWRTYRANREPAVVSKLLVRPGVSWELRPAPVRRATFF